MTRIVSQENRGAGFYGGSAPSHKTKCPQSNNPFGHSDECPCRRPPVPAVQPEPQVDEVVEFPPSPHAWFDGPEAA